MFDKEIVDERLKRCEIVGKEISTLLVREYNEGRLTFHDVIGTLEDLKFIMTKLHSDSVDKFRRVENIMELLRKGLNDEGIGIKRVKSEEE
jgi:hypothetical protein